MARILCVGLLWFIWQCSSDKANDTPSSASAPPPSVEEPREDECPQLALDMFEEHIQPGIDASCSGGDCHGAAANPAGAGLELLKREENSDTVTINRARMRSHRNNWLIKDRVLLEFVTDEVLHPGADQVAAGHITEAGITAWVAAEKACS